ncbi:MAG: MFS transporter [Pseudomonadota bacterium]
MQTIDRLTFSAFGMHAADQIAIVTVPLVAALVFKASPETIGLLVACQAMAHLLGSIPFGLVVDRVAAHRVAVAATLISLIGFFGIALSVRLESLIGFAAAVTFSGFGIVLFVLVSLSILPVITGRNRLANANARLELPRALTTFAVPLAVGLVFNAGVAEVIFLIATLAAATAFAGTLGLPRFASPQRSSDNMLKQIVEGGHFVIRQDLLRPIALCAVFWNFGFAALLVIMVPWLINEVRIDPGAFGIGLSAFGAATIVGSALSARFADRVSPNLVLLFGPGSSLVAVFALLLIPTGGSVWMVGACWFFIGFGPSMWLIAQNSIRQLVTPGAMLGRVNAVIQTAIYGVRPLGALAGGMIAGATSPTIALAFTVLVFGLSFAAALFSRLRDLRTYNELDPVTRPVEATV